MTRQALGAGATFIIWPESSTPFYFEQDSCAAATIRRLARSRRDAADRQRPGRAAAAARRTRSDARYYNAAFLVRPDGQVGAVYRKMHLVPFGEYVPLKRLLFFVGPIVEAVSAFTPGDRPGAAAGRRSPGQHRDLLRGDLPDLIRRFVRDGSELLTTITNDAWYGRSSAAYQHWDQAAMRAIEHGRYLARAANTGISGFVDPYGRVVAEDRALREAVARRGPPVHHRRTIYSRIGDLCWLSLACRWPRHAGVVRCGIDVCRIRSRQHRMQ